MSDNTFYDVTVPIRHHMPGWPGDPEVEVRRTSFAEKGDTANVSTLILSSHAGTHVDPPRHFIPDGKTVDQLDPGVFLGPCYVADLSNAVEPGGASDRKPGDVPGRGSDGGGRFSDVSAAALEKAGIPPGTRRLLVRTANCAPASDVWSDARFRQDYVGLAPDGAEWVRERGIKLLGWDYLSVETFFTDAQPVHRTLLGAGVVVLEGLDLRRLPPGSGCYALFCLPLLIQGGDGAPARVLLSPLSRRLPKEEETSSC